METSGLQGEKQMISHSSSLLVYSSIVNPGSLLCLLYSNITELSLMSLVALVFFLLWQVKYLQMTYVLVPQKHVK